MSVQCITQMHNANSKVYYTVQTSACLFPPTKYKAYTAILLILLLLLLHCNNNNNNNINNNNNL